MKVRAVKDVGNVSKSSDYVKQKKVERVGGWGMTPLEAFENPNGRPGLDAGYTGTAGGGNTYATAIKEGKAHASVLPKAGASSDPDARVMAVAGLRWSFQLGNFIRHTRSWERGSGPGGSAKPSR